MNLAMMIYFIDVICGGHELGGKSLDVLNKAMDEYLQEGKSATTISPEKVEKEYEPRTTRKPPISNV